MTGRFLVPFGNETMVPEGPEPCALFMPTSP